MTDRTASRAIPSQTRKLVTGEWPFGKPDASNGGKDEGLLVRSPEPVEGTP